MLNVIGNATVFEVYAMMMMMKIMWQPMRWTHLLLSAS